MTSRPTPISGPIGREDGSMRAFHVACAVLVPLLWGAQYAVVKVGLAVFPPLFFAGLRFALIALLMIPIVGSLDRKQIGSVLLISIFMGGINFGGAFLGLMRVPAGMAGVANQLWTPFTMLLARPILGERLSLRVMLGVGLAFAGVALTITDPTAPVPIPPTLMVVASAAGLATGNVLIKRLGPFDPARLFAWISLFTAIQLLALSLIFERGQATAIMHSSGSEWAAFAFTVFLSGIVAFSIWFWLIARFSITRVAPFALLQSFFAIAAGVILRDEPVTAALVVGAVICLAGVIVTQLSAPPTRSNKLTQLGE